MFGSKIEDNFEFEINWQKPYIINVKCQKCVYPDLKRSGDTSYTGPCTDVNVDGVLKLQYYQDTYISHCAKLAVKRHKITHSLKIFKLCTTRTSFNIINH